MTSAHEFLQGKTHDKHLLAVPHSDVFGTNNESNSGKSTVKSSDKDSRPEKSPLLLIQFPDKNWSTADLRQASFVVNSHTGLVHLVAEEKARSYSLHKVETSNALVLVSPPSSLSVSEKVKTPTTENTGEEPSPKRTKKQSLNVAHARLLQKGDGASFLELREYQLPWKLLVEICMVNPRPTLSQLSQSVGCSTSQVEKALHSLRHVLVQFPDQTVGPWPKYAFQQSLEHIIESAILATFNEVGSDWQVLPDNIHDLVKERLPPSIVDQVTDLEHWIHQTLHANSLSSSKTIAEKAVAHLTARDLFRHRTKWPSADFWKRWSMEMPGTDSSIHASYLKGLAVQTTEQVTEGGENASERLYWVSLPLEELFVLEKEKEENIVLAAMAKLFDIQRIWSKHDLEPYLEQLKYWMGYKDTSEFEIFLQIGKLECGTDCFELKNVQGDES